MSRTNPNRMHLKESLLILLANVLFGIFIALLFYSLFIAWINYSDQGWLNLLFWMLIYALPSLLGILIVELFIEVKEIKALLLKKRDEQTDKELP